MEYEARASRAGFHRIRAMMAETRDFYKEKLLDAMTRANSCDPVQRRAGEVEVTEVREQIKSFERCRLLTARKAAARGLTLDLD